MRRAWLVASLLGAIGSPSAFAQRAAADPVLLQERKDQTDFLRLGPISPYAAVAHQVLGTGLTLGPADADIPIKDLPRTEVRVAGRSISLREADGTVVTMARGSTTATGSIFLMLRGTVARPVITVFGESPARIPAPQYYPPSSAATQIGELHPPKTPKPLTLLDAEGVDVDAAEAGMLVLPTGDSLRVRRIAQGEDESELEVFFRDATNGKTTYPAGRFVTLVSNRDGRWVIDFNRARNPACAYNTVFPCPAPWPGNTLRRAITAGERYKGK